MSYYFEIKKCLNEFCDKNIDRLIGDLSLNEISELTDDIDNAIRNKK